MSSKIALLVIVLLTACRPESPPVHEGKASADIANPIPPAELSRFSVPLEYDFTPLVQLVDRVVPKKFGSIDKVHPVPGDSRRRFAYEAVRGPFTAFATGSTVHLRATLSYQARGYYNPIIGPTVSAGCGKGEQRPRVVVELVTPLTLDARWHLVSHARLARLEPATDSARDRCEASVLHYDVTDKVISAARAALTTRLRDVDRRIASVNLNGKFNDWWQMLHRPVRLKDGVWLILAPEQFRLGKISGRQRTLTIQATMDARPRIVTGPEPAVMAPELPPLTFDSIADGFHVTIDGFIDFATASRAMNAALAGKAITAGDHTVIIREITVSGAPQRKLALDVAFKGDAFGVVRFVGTPRLNPQRTAIDIPDLDYDLTTNNQALGAYAWVKSGTLRATFREKAHLPVLPALERGRELMTAGLNRQIGKAITLSATLDSMAARGIFVTATGVVVRADVTGRAGMKVSQPTIR